MISQGGGGTPGGRPPGTPPAPPPTSTHLKKRYRTVMKPSISRSRASTAALSAEAGSPSSRASGSNERLSAERCCRKRRRTYATSEREDWRWQIAMRSGVRVVRTLANRIMAACGSGTSGRRERKNSASLSAVLGATPSTVELREPHTWMLAMKHRRASQDSSKPVRLRLSSSIVPALSCEPTTSSACRIASMWGVMTECTRSMCSSSQRESTTLLRTSLRGQAPTSRCVSSSNSALASVSTCGLPTIGWRAGRFPWQQLIVHCRPSEENSSLSTMAVSVSRKPQASAKRWILSSPNARRSA
mmetsp:Transcript_22089/g.66374  ORF Transcript_22089/g.66374 Transcript_22089/m.66374 type:complete len:302 (+) Transcript_22089:391-1296(+)